jgi:hypothetical protein
MSGQSARESRLTPEHSARGLRYRQAVKRRLEPLKSWFHRGGPHGITLGVDVVRALGLSRKKHETAHVHPDAMVPLEVPGRGSGVAGDARPAFSMRGA